MSAFISLNPSGTGTAASPPSSASGAPQPSPVKTSPFLNELKSSSRFYLLAGCPLKAILPFISISMTCGTPETLYVSSAVDLSL